MNKQIIIHYVFVSIICALIAYFGFSKIQEVRTSHNWPSVQGEVLKSWVQKRSRIKEKTTYYPMIEYKYEIQGKVYINDRVTLSTKNVGGGTAKSIVKKYPVGSKAEIFYNPKQPDKSIMMKTDDITLGLLCMIPAIFWILYMLFNRDKKKNQEKRDYWASYFSNKFG